MALQTGKAAPKTPEAQQQAPVVDEIPFDLASVDDTTAAIISSERSILAEVIAEEEVSTETLPAVTSGSAPRGNVLKELEEEGFEGLTIDWTSFPSISLKNEGWFEDFDGTNYGKEFNCKLIKSTTRWVWRGVPVEDNKKDVAFTYDRIRSQNGLLIEDIKKDWEARGKTPVEKEYLEVMVEMVAPGEPYDGELRILSVSPTSKGRYTGTMIKNKAYAKAKGLATSDVITRVFVGPKVTKVQNPFYPWMFERVKD